ncbi:hypothetical protein AXG93_146s1440 [Marchantia polymorpha subsp. ruderalis]|uniref:Uncharacterized protein n=1 Tax=Marchantia polymorpha subsp. ruderalis TaxID=1480154 RepID=A0A176WAB9_MARPO|nr:hypothetical protein AXG93_146s1440 [Marchantia polymorpha subsp. ruderalis]
MKVAFGICVCQVVQQWTSIQLHGFCLYTAFSNTVSTRFTSWAGTDDMEALVICSTVTIIGLCVVHLCQLDYELALPSAIIQTSSCVRWSRPEHWVPVPMPKGFSSVSCCACLLWRISIGIFNAHAAFHAHVDFQNGEADLHVPKLSPRSTVSPIFKVANVESASGDGGSEVFTFAAPARRKLWKRNYRDPRGRNNGISGIFDFQLSKFRKELRRARRAGFYGAIRIEIGGWERQLHHYPGRNGFRPEGQFEPRRDQNLRWRIEACTLSIIAKKFGAVAAQQNQSSDEEPEFVFIGCYVNVERSVDLG